MKYPKSFEMLVDSLRRLPGVGTKSAERMAYQILDMKIEDVEEFSLNILNSKKNLKKCRICGQICEDSICDVCSDETRDDSVLCVVQTPKDAFALDRAQEYRGKFHILYGVISAVNGVGPNDLNISSLIERIKEGKIQEVIIATNPNIEGETTALYLKRILEPYKVEVTRIAYGLPVGGNLDYADDVTLFKALEGRRKL